MELAVSASVSPSIRAVPRRRLAVFFTLEGLGGIGGNLLMVAIFFYMQKRFGWGARRNLLLSAAEGAAYVIGALASNPLSKRVDRRTLLWIFHITMAAAALAGAWCAAEGVVVVLLLIYVMFSAAQWPVLESLVSAGAAPAELSRLISIYNLVWSGVGALTIAGCGILIARFPPGVFLGAVVVHLVAMGILLRLAPQPMLAASAHLAPEPDLIPLRTLAMRLSRITLPATFAVLYALGAMMPTLPVIRSATPEIGLLLASVWMSARWFCFVFLGLTTWWHTRPRALLGAAIVLLPAFLGITLRDSLISMILWQIVLGFAMGLIYSGSLYFGMVLSDGSTAQNSYHEGLIGLGCILGPGSGALAGEFWPESPHASIVAVSVVLWISILIATVVSLQSGRNRRSPGLSATT